LCAAHWEPGRIVYPVFVHHEGHEVAWVEDRGWKIEDGKFLLRSSILDPPSSAIFVLFVSFVVKNIFTINREES
jgi:hypothetical protein